MEDLPQPQPEASPAKTLKRRPSPYDERPYVWCARLALEIIQRLAGVGPNIAFLTAAYIAICRLSSERKNACEVQATISVIAGLIGLRYRKTQMLLEFLEKQAGVIRSIPAIDNKDGQIYIIKTLSTRARACMGKKDEPAHGDAPHPCTEKNGKRADSLKRKKQKSRVGGAQPQKRGFSVSRDKKSADTTAAACPAGSAAVAPQINEMPPFKRWVAAVVGGDIASDKRFKLLKATRAIGGINFYLDIEMPKNHSDFGQMIVDLINNLQPNESSQKPFSFAKSRFRPIE